MFRVTSWIGLCVAGAGLALGCGSSSEQSTTAVALRGTSFEDASQLLSPYKRSGRDGLLGLAWIDYDVDGDLDLFIPGGVDSPSALFRNKGDGTFDDVTERAGLVSTSGYGGVAVGDLDNDGYPDIYASAEGNDFFYTMNRPSVFHNNGDGTFTDVAEAAGVRGMFTSSGVTLGDFNRDGYLDIFLASSAHRRELIPPAIYDTDVLYLNNGDMTFTDVTVKAGVQGGHGSCVTSFSDYDGDGWLDIWVGVCNDVDDMPTPFYLYRNNHDGTFTDVADKAGLNADPGYWMAITFGDIDNDGDLDMFSTNFGPVTPQGPPEPHVLFRNNGNGTYSSVPNDKLWLNTFAFGATFGDWDNDGWQDLYVIGDQALAGFVGPGAGTPGYLYFNDGKGQLDESPSPPGRDLSSKFTSGVAKGDFNNDGFLDLAVAASAFEAQDPNTGEVVLSDEGAPALFTNHGNANHWVTIRLTGTESNRMAVGAKLELDTPGGPHQTQETYAGSAFLSGESPWPTFGMGGSTKASLKVSWPSGRKEWFSVTSDHVVDLTEGTGSASALTP